MRPAAAAAVLAAVLGGCGLNVQSPDLFLLTRTGPGGKLTLEVSDGGTLRCNGGQARTISSARLISARDLADNLAQDAQRNLSLPAPAGSVYAFRIVLQQGTIRFADRDAQRHPELADAVLFATQAAEQVCGPAG
ncbi:MAG TPA: hypothetical protein VF781_04550 [Solirubrobacteraceae bacterium]